MSTFDVSAAETFACRIAEEAGQLVMPGFGSAKASIDKGSNGFATEMDLASERLIVDAIRTTYPDHSILTEEKLSEDKSSEYTWVIDPIDGTHNYMHGVPLFAVSIGLKRGDEHIMGVVHIPLRNETYHAHTGGGAWCGDTRISCSQTDALTDAFLSVEVTREMTEKEHKRLKQFGSSVFRFRSMGSAACSLAYVAAGVFDGYIDLHSRAMEWDWAAGKVLVQEAGGTFDIDAEGIVMATNAPLMPAICDIVQIC